MRTPEDFAEDLARSLGRYERNRNWSGFRREYRATWDAIRAAGAWEAVHAVLARARYSGRCAAHCPHDSEDWQPVMWDAGEIPESAHAAAHDELMAAGAGYAVATRWFTCERCGALWADGAALADDGAWLLAVARTRQNPWAPGILRTLIERSQEIRLAEEIEKEWRAKCE